MGALVLNNTIHVEDYFHIPEGLSNGIYLIKIDGIVSQEKLVLLR
jgi:hypothetical protein